MDIQGMLNEVQGRLGALQEQYNDARRLVNEIEVEIFRVQGEQRALLKVLEVQNAETQDADAQTTEAGTSEQD